jgi:hypothetical protein
MQSKNLTNERNGMKNKWTFRAAAGAAVLATGLALSPLGFAADEKAADVTTTLKGEIVDLMCYLDHGAKGEKHKGCAEKCIKSGGPVGLLSEDHIYLVIGNHEPINEKLAPKAAQTVTLKGKLVEKHGMKMLENAVLVED